MRIECPANVPSARMPYIRSSICMCSNSPLSFSAGTREGLLPRLQPDGARVRRQAEPGHVAGRLALRAPRPRGLQESASDGERGPPGSRQDTPVAQLASGVDEQLAGGQEEGGNEIGDGVRCSARAAIIAELLELSSYAICERT